MNRIKTLSLIVLLSVLGCDIETIEGLDGDDGENGQNGQNGGDGDDGEEGEPGIDGLDGEEGEPGDDGLDGIDGEPGQQGAQGQPGAGTRVVHTVSLDGHGDSTVQLGDISSMPSITALCYDSDEYGRVYGAAWYVPAMGLKTNGDLMISMNGKPGATCKVVVVR